MPIVPSNQQEYHKGAWDPKLQGLKKLRVKGASRTRMKATPGSKTSRRKQARGKNVEFIQPAAEAVEAA